MVLNSITLAYAVERGMDIMSLDQLAQEIRGPLPLIAGMGSSLVEPTGFVLMNVTFPAFKGTMRTKSPWSWTTLG